MKKKLIFTFWDFGKRIVKTPELRETTTLVAIQISAEEIERTIKVQL